MKTAKRKSSSRSPAFLLGPSEIHLERVKEGAKAAIVCPHCKGSVLNLYHDCVELPNGKHFCHDGDTIQEIYPRLSEAQQTPDGFIVSLLEGSCSHCHEAYHVVQATFMNSSFDLSVDYLAHNVDRGNQSNFLGMNSLHEQICFMEEYATKGGICQDFMFGPYPLLDGESLAGEYGVSCHEGSDEAWKRAADILFHYWDSMRSLHPEISPIAG